MSNLKVYLAWVFGGSFAVFMLISSIAAAISVAHYLGVTQLN